MTNVTEDEITKLKAQPKTELEKIYENRINAQGDLNDRDLVSAIIYLESLPIEKSLIETLALVYRRLTFFAQSLPPVKRETALTKIIKFSQCNVVQMKENRSRVKFKNLSRPHRTICNHFMDAFVHYKTAEFMLFYQFANDQLAIIAQLISSIEHIYKGDNRLIRESAITQKEIALHASATRQLSYIPAQNQTVNLLKSLAPTEGWISKAQASKIIAPELEKFLETEGISAPNRITPGNVQRRIRAWLDSAPLVKNAFHENYLFKK